jgi:predicted  nucleic acid-binding Zn-ribbon protein
MKRVKVVPASGKAVDTASAMFDLALGVLVERVIAGLAEKFEARIAKLEQDVDAYEGRIRRNFERHKAYVEDKNAAYGQAVEHGNETIRRGNAIMDKALVRIGELESVVNDARQEIKDSKEARAQDLTDLKIQLFDALVMGRGGGGSNVVTLQRREG